MFFETAARAILAVVGVSLVLAAGTAEMAFAKEKRKAVSPLMFDAATRKKTKSQLTERIKYSAYVNLRYGSEANRNLDDGISDRQNRRAIYGGIALSSKLTEKVRAFAHLEFRARQRSRDGGPFKTDLGARVKEAHLSFQLAETTSLTMGRMRFSDRHRWIADASVDGLHFSKISGSFAFELAVVKDVFSDEGNYLIAHATRFSGAVYTGLYVIAEDEDDQQRLHVIGYFQRKPYEKFAYAVHAAGIFGDAQNGNSNGFGFDLRGIYKLNGKYNPQVVLGLAAGSKGFRQTGLHSQKTYDGGLMQFDRYGYVFRPELTNLAIATLTVGLRPSRMFSLDLATHAYFQLSPSTIAPDARIRGATSGSSSFVGTEVSLVGAWRPTKKTKFEFGAGVFNAGTAYVNRETAHRIFTRFSIYF